MNTVPDSDSVPDADIDATLRVYGFDPDERYPEHSHDALRTAWREGYENGAAATLAGAQ